ncbi:MAG: DNA helicase PcrA [Gloeomargaritaceae cyanobacterium C42_A2020_066]|nr:DNA helicase PcrA [Gloeomargaritaceae cyanobacterium C42_A2020_066]
MAAAHSDFLHHLNPAQRQAAQHYCGPLLVVAGAGSGKTRALTYRIANLLLQRRVDPESILAVTFTNKAAREIKERVETLLAEQQALTTAGRPLGELPASQQTRLRSEVYRRITKPMWMGTFHSLCARILRLDIEKYQDEQGRRWEKTFSILDESDTQALVKDIVLNDLNLDEKRFEPRSVRYAISHAKNQGLTPRDVERQEANYRGRVVADIYTRYQQRLAENNALDFDDLIGIPVRLFRQNEQILAYWHQRFRHILVDEYQDTNRIQYDLVQLLTTNGEDSRTFEAWQDRSIFVVGDADQSIYKFRGADFTILLGFQGDFGDGLPDDDTRTMIKLEENYRSTATILTAANALIEHNTERIDKILRPTRDPGEAITCYAAEDEQDEAHYVVQQIRTLARQNSALNWGDFAILYRTNAQSRVFEDILVRANLPYVIIGGLRFYERKEIKDALAYLRLLINPADSLSLLRVINTPRRGIGKTTLDRLQDMAQTLGLPLWEVLQDGTAVQTAAGRAARPIETFVNLLQRWRVVVDQTPAPDLIQGILEESGYRRELEVQGTDESLDRLQNLQELYNAALQYGEENEDPSLAGFLQNVSLASDLDGYSENQPRVTLMTLHSSKGLEFPVVFMVGMEQGLFPNFRSMNDPAALEEERRLCYVGITRAQECLFLSHAASRRLYGNQREAAIPSDFLSELPRDCLRLDGSGRPNPYRMSGASVSPDRRRPPEPMSEARAAVPQTWAVGDQLIHDKFGPGEVTHVFGEGQRLNLAVRFVQAGHKILDPKLARLRKVN